MKKYMSFFKIKFSNGLQYRVAAYAGISTQFAWGFMNILMFRAFYQSNPSAFPMTFSQFASYIWLQQALLAMFALWFWESDIFEAIASGNIAYELVRPINVYNMWFVRNAASRLSRVVLRCLPILIVAAIVPQPYGISSPAGIAAAVMFIISAFAGFFVVIAYAMLFYVVTFYSINSSGIRILAASIVEFLSGALIPLPFLPNTVRFIFDLLPFASMQNVPFLIYTGYISGKDAVLKIVLQLFWFAFLFILGKILTERALQRVVVQGG